MDWSGKQKRILTGGERADELYTPERGYAFEENELPHHHLIQSDTHAAFANWREQATKLAGSKRDRDETASPNKDALISAWKRTLFYGGWEHTSSRDEITFNLQTRNLFIDLRIPRTRKDTIAGSKSSLLDLNKEELRCYARQHVFSGYTKVDTHGSDLLCTRHHCIDWNFVGIGRTRPNKWYAELQQEGSTQEVQTWKEWAFAKDERGQHYYCEHWQRLPQGGSTPFLALRKPKGSKQDGIIVIVGNHFSYVLARDLSQLSEEKRNEYSKHGSLGGLVDAALDQNDLDTARAYLSTQGGHGIISKDGWIVDCAIEPWKEGKPFWTASDSILLKGDTMADCKVELHNGVWEVFDTSLTSKEEISKLLRSGRH